MSQHRPYSAEELAQICRQFGEFVTMINHLRHPVTGCPWDLEQSFATLRPYMLEEAQEAVEAMTSGKPKKITDELGDVLLQVVLNAQIARDEGLFDIRAIIANIHAKMVRRHPHVFGTPEERAARSPEQIKKRWYEIKAMEKAMADDE